MVENPTQQPKIYPFPLPEKFPLNNFTSSAIESVILSPSNSNFHLITLYRLHLQLQPLLLYQLILINRCLLNLVFSIILPRKISVLPTFQCYLENPVLNACFPLFHTPFLYFKLYKISTDCTPVGWDFVPSELIKYNGFQNSENETPYLMP